MRKQFITYLKDPQTLETLRISQVLGEKNGHLTAGILKSRSNWYPVINGIPRLVINELKTNLLQTHYDFLKKYRRKLEATIVQEWQTTIDEITNFDAFIRHQKKTAESFAYEWKHIYKENDYEKQNFFHFLSPFVKEADLRSQVTLDIGCGSGRFTKWAALSQTKVSFGTDLGETVEVAYEMTKNLPNICIVQADIYDMPFQGVVDFVYSIGVLHHLPQPQEGFSRLPKVLKKGGRMLVWVYNRRGNGRAIYFYEPLRVILKQLPKPVLYKLCYLPGGAVHLINLLGSGLEKVGLQKLAKKLPFSYYANFPFNMKLNDAFDVLATPKSNYYYREEIEQWFKESKLKQVKAYEHPEAGITGTGLN